MSDIERKVAAGSEAGKSGAPRLSYAQKWEQMNNLRQTAWNLKFAAVKLAHPDWTDEQITARVREIFLYATT